MFASVCVCVCVCVCVFVPIYELIPNTSIVSFHVLQSNEK